MNSKIIPYGKHNITKEDIDAVVNVLKSDYLTQGPKIKEFESAFANYVDSKYAVAVSNGTAALHLCCISLGIELGDKVITTPITFAASANCVRYCGGEVVFSDIDPKTLQLDIDKVKILLETAPKGTYKGIIAVDFAGRAVDLEKFRSLANKHNLWIIEDACHAPGAFFVDSKGKKQNSGNGNFADLAIFSFHPVKHIASGEGGMVTTNNKKLYDRLIKLRTHGITKDKDTFLNSYKDAGGIDDYPNWYMEMQNLGFNYRLTDFQAALGLSQLKRADIGVDLRRKIAKKYFESFKNKDYIINQSGYIEGHAYHLYVLEVKDRLNLYNYLRDNNIYAQIHYFPCHLMPYYKKFGWKKNDMPFSERYYKNCISLPLYPNLGEDQNYVIKKINEFYSLSNK